MKPDNAPRNPYEVSKRDVGGVEAAEENRRPAGLLANAIINAFVSFFAAAGAESTLSGYRQMFEQFGVPLSSATRLILGSSLLWWLFAIVGSALAWWVIVNPVIKPDKLRRMKLAVRTFTVLLGVFLAYTLYAVFVPMMKLGSVV